MCLSSDMQIICNVFWFVVYGLINQQFCNKLKLFYSTIHHSLGGVNSQCYNNPLCLTLTVENLETGKFVRRPLLKLTT